MRLLGAAESIRLTAGTSTVAERGGQSICLAAGPSIFICKSVDRASFSFLGWGLPATASPSYAKTVFEVQKLSVVQLKASLIKPVSLGARHKVEIDSFLMHEELPASYIYTVSMLQIHV